MNLKPVNDKVLIKRFSGEKKSAGGILYTDLGVIRSKEGRVIAVGNGVKESIKPGDSVFFESYVDDIVDYVDLPEGEELVIVQETKVLAKK